MDKKFTSFNRIIAGMAMIFVLGNGNAMFAQSRVQQINNVRSSSNYVSQLKQEANILKKTFGSEDAKVIERQWKFIGQALGQYYESSRGRVASAAFSHNMYELYKLSYTYRAEAGGFAKGFVREAFLQAGINVVENWEFWKVPMTDAQMRVAMEKVKACILTSAVIGAVSDENPFLLAIGATEVCGEMAVIVASEMAGNNHFEHHLAPAFRDHIRREFTKIAKENPKPNVAEALATKIKEISQEHEQQFKLALVPAIKKVNELPEPVRFAATEVIPRKARELRFNTFKLILSELEEQSLLKEEVVEALLEIMPGETSSKGSDKSEFEVTSKTSTGILVKEGEIVEIVATGKILLGFIAGRGTPDGIRGFKNYSEVLNAPHGALMARVKITGSEEWILIGSNGSFTAPKRGILELLVNDADPGNNQGSFNVKVNIKKK